MAERRTNASQFAGVNALQKDIERLTKERDAASAERDALTKERENAQTELLKEHSVALKKMNDTLICLLADLQGLPKRVTTLEKWLEKWKSYLSGIVTACTVIGAILGWAIGLLFKGR